MEELAEREVGEGLVLRCCPAQLAAVGGEGPAAAVPEEEVVVVERVGAPMVSFATRQPTSLATSPRSRTATQAKEDEED